WRLSLISLIYSQPPLNANLGADLDGDGNSTTPLPGTFFNSFGRSVSAGKLRELVAVYNADIEARTTPAIGPDGKPIIGADGKPVLLRPRTSKNEVLNPIVLPDHFDSGDSFFSQDVRVTRMIRVREKYQLSLIGEAFNLFNIANLTGYDSGLNSG